MALHHQHGLSARARAPRTEPRARGAPGLDSTSRRRHSLAAARSLAGPERSLNRLAEALNLDQEVAPSSRSRGAPRDLTAHSGRPALPVTPGGATTPRRPSARQAPRLLAAALVWLLRRERPTPESSRVGANARPRRAAHRGADPVGWCRRATTKQSTLHCRSLRARSVRRASPGARAPRLVTVVCSLCCFAQRFPRPPTPGRAVIPVPPPAPPGTTLEGVGP